MDVSDRRMQVQLTQEAKIDSDFYSIRAIFAFVGFVSALRRSRLGAAVSIRAISIAFCWKILYNGRRQAGRIG